MARTKAMLRTAMLKDSWSKYNFCKNAHKKWMKRYKQTKKDNDQALRMIQLTQVFMDDAYQEWFEIRHPQVLNKPSPKPWPKARAKPIPKNKKKVNSDV